LAFYLPITGLNTSDVNKTKFLRPKPK